jgi:Trypsin-co-occurring domain 2
MTENRPPNVRLADAIAELRAEISRARQEGEGKDVRFSAKAIEVELSVDFGWAAEGTAGVSKWIPFVDLGVKGSGSEKSLHKVTLTLEIDTAGEPSKGLISDSSGPAPVKPRPGT